MPKSSYKSGSWWSICDVCGFKHKADELRKRWDGLMVCEPDFELDHPQKYLRVRETGQAVPWIRDEPADTFLHICYVYAIAGYADLGEADCMRADISTPSYAYLYALKNASLG